MGTQLVDSAIAQAQIRRRPETGRHEQGIISDTAVDALAVTKCDTHRSADDHVEDGVSMQFRLRNGNKGVDARIRSAVVVTTHVFSIMQMS